MSHGISVECEGHVDDDEVVDHVLAHPELMQRVFAASTSPKDGAAAGIAARANPMAGAQSWAETFAAFDAIDRERAADRLIQLYPDYFATPASAPA